MLVLAASIWEELGTAAEELGHLEVAKRAFSRALDLVSSSSSPSVCCLISGTDMGAGGIRMGCEGSQR